MFSRWPSSSIAIDLANCWMICLSHWYHGTRHDYNMWILYSKYVQIWSQWSLSQIDIHYVNSHIIWNDIFISLINDPRKRWYCNMNSLFINDPRVRWYCNMNSLFIMQRRCSLSPIVIGHVNSRMVKCCLVTLKFNSYWLWKLWDDIIEPLT